jgi:hypothetical protein
MKANVKGFIRNLVSDILDEVIEKKIIKTEYDEPIDKGDEEYWELEKIANEVTERWLECIKEEL